MASWKNAIENYDECSKTIAEDNAEEVKTEGVEIRTIRDQSKKREEDALKKLEEEDEKAQEREEHEKQREAESLDKMRTQLNSIKESVNQERQKQEKERLRVVEERKRLEELQSFLHYNEDCLNQEEQKKMIESEEDAIDSIEDKNDNNVSDMMTSTKSKIMSEAEKARALAVHAEQDQLAAERVMNDKLKNMMIQVTIGYEQVLDSKDCSSDDLGLFPTNAMPKICGNIFAVSKPIDLGGLLNCINPSNFCTSCCDHYIGMAHEMKRLECKQECKDKLKGVGPQVLVPVEKLISGVMSNKNQMEKLKQTLTQKYTQTQMNKLRRRRRRL